MRPWSKVWLFVLLVPVFWLLSPAGINGDGIGYLNQVQGEGLTPGHPGYLPLIRAVAWLVGHDTLMELVAPLRLLSICCAVVALALFHDACARAAHLRGAVQATVLLAGSHAFFRSATEIEAYAPAALCATATLWALMRHREQPATRWAVAAGVASGVGVTMHLTLALLALPVTLELWRSSRSVTRPAAAVGIMTALACAVLGLALGREGADAPGEAWAWLMASDHGMPYRHSLWTPLKGVWGFCRALVHAPYPYEAGLPRVILFSGMGAVGWALLLWLRFKPGAMVLAPFRRSGMKLHRAPMERRPGSMDLLGLLVWLVPLGAFALFFFPADSERWIFVLPAVMLYLAPGLGVVIKPPSAGVHPLLRGPSATVVGMVLMSNLATYQLPAAMDDHSVDRAAVADRLLKRGDLVVSPGHGWGELVGLTSRRPARRYPLVYHVGALGSVGAAVAQMHLNIDRTLRSGGKVYAARLRDPADPRGFKELAWFGVSEEDYLDLFKRYRAAETGVVGMLELSKK